MTSAGTALLAASNGFEEPIMAPASAPRSLPTPTLPALPDEDAAAVLDLAASSANEEDVVRGIVFDTVACRIAGCSRGVNRTILRDVSGVCRAGELLAVMGPSGCGKTTLLDILSGRKNTGRVSGEIRIDSEALTSRTRRSQTSMVFQDDVSCTFIVIMRKRERERGRERERERVGGREREGERESDR